MSKRKKSFGSAPKTHKRRAEVEASTARYEAKQVKFYLAKGHCESAFGFLTSLNRRVGKISANAQGYKKRNSLGGGTRSVAHKLNSLFSRKCVRAWDRK